MKSRTEITGNGNATLSHTISSLTKQNLKTYPIWVTKESDGIYFIEIPDLNQYTQGLSLENVKEMAEDMIKIIWVESLKSNERMPEPNTHHKKKEHKAKEMQVTVDLGKAVEEYLSQD